MKMFVCFGGSVTDTLQTVSERQTKVLLPNLRVQNYLRLDLLKVDYA